MLHEAALFFGGKRPYRCCHGDIDLLSCTTMAGFTDGKLLLGLLRCLHCLPSAQRQGALAAPLSSVTERRSSRERFRKLE